MHESILFGDLSSVGELQRASRVVLTQTRAELEDMMLRLEVVRSASIICISALRHQNCEIDEDVASVLQRNVGDKVGEEIERLNRLLNVLEPEPAEHE